MSVPERAGRPTEASSEPNVRPTVGPQCEPQNVAGLGPRSRRANDEVSREGAPTVNIEVISWVTKFTGGDGTGRRVFDEPAQDATVRSVLTALSRRFPELQTALWHGQEIGEHIEVLVNDAVLGINHTLDSRLAPGDRVTLLGQYMGG